MNTSFMHKSFLIRWFSLCSLLCLLWMPKDVLASHIVGGDIRYKCLGNNQYEIILEVYRDCFFGDPLAWFDNPASVAVYNKAGFLVTEVKMNLMQNDTLTSNLGDPCLVFPGDVCVHRGLYKKVVTLPFNANGYTLTYQRCCRNETIVNILNPLTSGATYTIELTPKAMLECNSAPYFNDLAPLFVCVNQPLVWDHSAMDSDGDSLVYVLAPPLLGGTFNNAQPIPPAPPPYSPVMWVDPPFNTNNMLGAGVPLTIDPQTGIMTALPTIQGQFVVGVCVLEYRDGELLSIVHRDFQWNVGVCGEVVSSFEAPDAQCDNLAVQFENTSTETTSYLWYFDFPNTTPSSTEENPMFMFPDTGTYTIALIAEPNSLCADTSYHQIFLQFNSTSADFNFTIFNCGDSSLIIVTDLSIDTVSAVNSWYWELTYGDGVVVISTEQNPTFLIPADVEATLQLIAISENGCIDIISETFITDGSFPSLFIADTLIICIGESVSLNPNFNQIVAGGYLWSPTNLLDDPTAPNPTTVPLDTTTLFTVRVFAPQDLCFFEKDVLVIVLPPPALSFDFFINCDNLTVDFTNTSAGADSFFWDFGDLTTNADTSSLENPSYTYPELGTYTVTLSTGPDAQCPGELIQDIEIPEILLIADYSYSYGGACDAVQATVLFTDASINSLDNTVSWEWIFSNGLGTANGDSAILIAVGSQTFDVTLIITTADGCTDTITQEVVIGLFDDVDDTLEPNLLICLGQSVPLNPNGNPVYLYEWSPAHSLDAPTAMNPIATPDTTTTYTVLITYIAGDTCTIEREVTVTVDTILPQLSFDYQIECNGATVVFTNTSVNSDDFFWTFGDPSNPGQDTSTQVSPAYTYPGIGSYTVILTTGATELCNDTLIVEIMLPERELEANFVYGWGICEIVNATVVFTDSSFNSLNNTVQWDWIFSNGLGTASGQQVTLEVQNGQSFNATLIITTDENCVDSITQLITIELIDIDADLSPYILICPGDIVALNPNGNPIYDYLWTPTTWLITPDDLPNPFAAPQGNITYDVEITYITIDTCTIFRQVTVELDSLVPVVDFDYTVDCDGFTVYFENLSTNGLGFIWNFGDPTNPGAGSTDVNPIYVYPDSGTYFVTLMTDGTNFCQDTIIKEIFLDDRTLIPAFGLELLNCDPDSLVVQFTDQSINPMNNIVEWQWVFSNGDTSSLQNPVIVLSESQNLIVEFTVITDEGCDSTLVDTIFVDLIFVDLEDEVLYCPGGPGVALNPNGSSNYTYVWTPADGLDDPTAANPIASPDSTTTYTVTITYITFDTCVIVEDITVFVPPVIGLSVSADVDTCAAFVSISAEITGDATSFFWLNANGDVLGNTLTINVPVSGVQQFIAYSEDEYGCVETDTATVQGGPVDIEMSPNLVICLGDAAPVFVVNLDPNDILSYQWDPSPIIIGGQNTSTPIIDQIPGEYWLTVTATNQFGCVAVDSVLVVIIDTDIVLSFGYIIQCDGLAIEFFNQSTDAFGFLWTFGNPALGTSTEFNPTFVFPEVGVYEVTLSLLYDADCVVPYIVTIELVEPILTADFTFSYAECAIDSLVIQFTDNSYNFQNNTTEWFWTFSNGQTSNEQNPVVVVYEGNSLIVTLNITTAINCEATVTDTINYHFYDDIMLEDTIVLCIGDSVHLNPNGNQNYDYLWIPSATLDDPTSFNPLAFPTETTDYNVFITFFDGNDTCTIEQTVTVFVPTPLELFTSADTTICRPDAIIFAVANVSPVTYIWSDDTGNTNYPNLPAIPVVVDFITSFYVQVIDEYDCSIFDTITVRNGEINIFTQSQIIICPMDSLQLNIENLDAIDTLIINWTAGPGGVIFSGLNTATPTVGTVPGPVVFSYEITNQFGCFLNGEVIVTMSDFDPILPDTARICTNVATPLNPDGNPNYVYEWSPTTGLSDPTSHNPSATLSMDMTYTVTITDFDGVDTCQEVLQIVVLVNSLIDLQTFGDTTLCEAGLMTTISANAPQAVSFVWSTNPSFDPIIGTGPQIDVTAEGTTIYYVQATDDLGCTEVGTVTILSYPVDISVAPNYNLCIFESLQIELINNAADQELVAIQWQPIGAIETGATTATPTVNPLESTSFYVEVMNQYGCIGFDSTFVTIIDVISTLFATADPDTIVAGSGRTSQLLTFFDPTYFYTWDPSFSLDNSTVFDPIASPEETTTYTVTVAGIADCSSSASVTVTVLNLACDEPYIYIPNGFSPNGDGNNDILYVRGANIDEVHLMIYNRWGQKVFESFDLNQGWDGTFKGEALTPDTYAFYMEVRCFGGELFVKKGNITLLR